MSRHDDPPAAPATPFEGFGQMFDSLEPFNQAWRTLHMHSPFKPTLDIKELDKRIQELRTVEQWLSLNQTMLRNTIQAMEVQRGTLQTLNQMSASLSAMTNTLGEQMRPDPGSPPKTSPNPLAGLWPGMAAWAGMPARAEDSPGTATPPPGSADLPGMNPFPGMPNLGAFGPLPGPQPFGGMPWMPNMGHMPDMSALFGAAQAASSTPDAHTTRATQSTSTPTTQHEQTPSSASSPSSAPSMTSGGSGGSTTAAPSSAASDRPGTHDASARTPAAPAPYTPPGWAAATGTDGWKAAVTPPPSPQPATQPAAEEDSTATLAAAQLAQAWWQLMQQQVSQMAAQAATPAGGQTPAPSGRPAPASNTATVRPNPTHSKAAPNAQTSARTAGKADAPSKPRHRKSDPSSSQEN